MQYSALHLNSLKAKGWVQNFISNRYLSTEISSTDRNLKLIFTTHDAIRINKSSGKMQYSALHLNSLKAKGWVQNFISNRYLSTEISSTDRNLKLIFTTHDAIRINKSSGKMQYSALHLNSLKAKGWVQNFISNRYLSTEISSTDRNLKLIFTTHDAIRINKSSGKMQYSALHLNSLKAKGWVQNFISNRYLSTEISSTTRSCCRFSCPYVEMFRTGKGKPATVSCPDITFLYGNWLCFPVAFAEIFIFECESS